MCETRPGDHVLLVVLEDRRARIAVAVAGDDDVEDRVQAAGAGERLAQRALGHGDRGGIVAAAVDHARDQPLLAQPPHLGGAARVAGLNLQLDSLACHFGAEV